MLILTIAELEKQGITSQEVEKSQQIKCVDKIMERVADFSNQNHYQACELGKSYLKLGIFSFVSESKIGLTVWKEKQNVDKQKIAQEIQTKMNQARVNTVANLFNHRKEQNLIKTQGKLQASYGQLVKRTKKSSIKESQSVSTKKIHSLSQLTPLQIANGNQPQKLLSGDTNQPKVSQHHNSLRTKNHQQFELNQNNQEVILLNSSQQQQQKRKYRGVSY